MDNIYHFPKSYFFTDREWFLANVTGYDTLLLHLSEGTVAFVAGINLCTGVNLGAFKNDPTITHTPPLHPPLRQRNLSSHLHTLLAASFWAW